MEFSALLAIVQGLNWGDALLGAVVGGAFAGSAKGVRSLANRRPLRVFLGQLVDPRRTVRLFLRDMTSSNGQYFAWDPVGPPKVWFNFDVVAQPDVAVAADVINLLGLAGRSSGFEYPRMRDGLTQWNEPVVCIGGSLKADQLFELGVPKLVAFEFNRSFVTPDGQKFELDGKHDHGLLMRTKHPQTGVDCWLIQGFGAAGTVAAGRFLLQRALDLAALFGSRPFAVILRTNPLHGPDSAEPVWIGGDTSFNRLFARPHIAFRYRKLLARRAAT